MAPPGGSLIRGRLGRSLSDESIPLYRTPVLRTARRTAMFLDQSAQRASGAAIDAGNPAIAFVFHVVRTQCRLIPVHRGSPTPSPTAPLVCVASLCSDLSAMSA